MARRRATRRDAETVLADDPEGFRHLHRVLHGRDEPTPDRRLPTLEERFGRAAQEPKPEARTQSRLCAADLVDDRSR